MSFRITEKYCNSFLRFFLKIQDWPFGYSFSNDMCMFYVDKQEGLYNVGRVSISTVAIDFGRSTS